MTVLTALAVCALGLAAVPAAASTTQSAATAIKVFLDCEDCFEDFLRTEAAFVDYVRDRTAADVHVLITRAETAASGREYTVAFIGSGRFAGVNHTFKTISLQGDPDDVIRRQLTNTLRIGLLTYLASGGVPNTLAVAVKTGSSEAPPEPASDRWNFWVFSLRGSAEFDGEESSRQLQLGVDVNADRITNEWKITIGTEIDHEEEEFDLDEDEPVAVERRQREMRWLVVKGLGEHWSMGAEGGVESSTFDNTSLAVAALPAVEFNVFPYSMYTRRQLRGQYSVGVIANRYYEETLFGKTQETLPQHRLSLTLDQREQWGTLQARTEWSQYLHDLDKTRLEVEGEVSLRLRRGLSVQFDVNASRIR